MKKIKTLAKRIGTQRSAQVMLKVLEESKTGEYDVEFRKTLTADERKLLNVYEEAYVVALLSRISRKIRSVIQ